MEQLTRRKFCSIAAALGATSICAHRVPAALLPLIVVSLAIDPSTSLADLPADFMGLSYESGQLSYPDFFSARNTALVEIFRTLSPSGVLRLGGNLSEFTIWSEKEPSTPPTAGGLVGPDPGRREPRTYTITPLSIHNLQKFLQATGWRCIYGLNLGGGTVEQALAEGACVAQTLGNQLICVQFGNEPDLFKHRDQGNRPWTYDEFLVRWKLFRAAFHEKLPHLPVAGPDTANNQQWVKQFLRDVPGEFMLATSHYYPEGPPTDPRMNIDLLLHPGEQFDYSCRQAIDAAKAAGVPFRMAEGNSCYNAGKVGVSDTFASALWVGDFCLQLASMGCVGVNLHGGANGFYSPITGSISSGFAVRPEFYGLMLAQEFAKHTLQRTTLETKGANLTAYAAGESGITRLVALFNKDARDVEVVLSAAGTGLKNGKIEQLQAPALDSKTGTTFRGATVAGSGEFHPLAGESVKAHGGRLSVRLPAYSAALIRLG
jgi:hypothetical protein